MGIFSLDISKPIDLNIHNEGDDLDEILEKLTCPFSDVSETHWAYNDILLAACEY